MGEKILDLLFPESIYCISCGSIIDATRPYSLCDDCVRRFGWVGKDTCEKCGKPIGAGSVPGFEARKLCYDCMQTAHIFDRGFTCCGYGLYERLLISDYKEGRHTYLGKTIGRMMADRWRYAESELREDLAEETDETVDVLTAVPSDAAKIRQRGFDQMGIVAKEVSMKTGIPYAPQLLAKKAGARAMRGLSGPERRSNVCGKYCVPEESREDAAGKRVLLLDDIYTTGSTVDECAKALKAAGAEAVFVLTFAAGGDRPTWEESEE